MKKLFITLFAAALLSSAVAASSASAAVGKPGCGSFGILHTGC